MTSKHCADRTVGVSNREGCGDLLAMLERWQDWPGPARLLILAPPEDDCVIAAGGVGAQNSRIGGTTRIV